MVQYQEVFSRYEQKYLLSEEQYARLRNRLDDFIVREKYGLYTIGNIYFDTDAHELIRSSIEKPVYKEKLRLRSYGSVKKTDPVFIELKKKYKGVVYKRRVKLPSSEAHDYLGKGTRPCFSSQIMNDIDWCMKRYQPSPKVYIAYDRAAFSGKEDGRVRITFDYNIRFRESSLDLSKGHWGTYLLDPGKILMEIKIPDAMPLWLTKIHTEYKVFPTHFLFTRPVIRTICSVWNNQKEESLCLTVYECDVRKLGYDTTAPDLHTGFNRTGIASRSI
jgi:hypothetical protein